MQPDATEPTPQQERAVEMLAVGQRVVEVSRALRVDRATVWRWTKLPEFQKAFDALHVMARRDAAERMRHNALSAVEMLGKILNDPRVSTRDRITAARTVLGAVREPFVAVDSGEPPPNAPKAGWRETVLDTASKADDLAHSGFSLILAKTPGAAWQESGLETAFPGSYRRVRALADRPAELRAECDRILDAYQDHLDAKAIKS